MKFDLLSLTIVIFFFLLPSYSVQADLFEDLTRFQLFTNCGKMDLVVENLSEDAKKIGLTKKAIANAVESRLRSAKLFSKKEPASYLYIYVNVIGHAFGTSVAFNKPLYDAYTGMTFPATTWTGGATGTHGSNSGYIMSYISQHIDEFLVDYLRVNGKACEKR